MNKVKGPAVSLTFLGIRLCSSPCRCHSHLRSPPFTDCCRAPLLKCVSDVQTLEWLVGYLVHATKVGPLAKPFLGGLFQVLRGTRPGQPRRLNVATRADLAWWYSLLTYWLGVSPHQFLVLLQPDKHLFMDASESGGAVLGFSLLGSKCPGLQTTVCLLGWLEPLPLLHKIILTPCHAHNSGVSHPVCCLLGIRGTLCLPH